MYTRACARHFYLPSLSALNYSSFWGLCVLVSVTLAGSSQSCVNAHAGACACCDLTLSVLSQVVIQVAHQQQPLSLSLSLSHYILLLFPFPTFSLFLFWCKSVCECVYVGPFLDYAFSPLVLEFMRGPDRGIMDGGTWLPLRIRYLPRWHHTGSYQLYPGEEIAGALNTCFSNWRKCRFCSQGSNEANMLDSRRFFMLKIQFGFFRPVKEVKEKYHKMEIAC